MNNFKKTNKIGQLLNIMLVLFFVFLSSCNQPTESRGDTTFSMSSSRSLASNATTLSTDDGWVTETNIYQVYVDRFASNLDGVTAKIDYLKRLGVKTIWLMPIFQAMNDHGYNVTDFYSVSSKYGSNQDLLELVDAAHSADMRVVLDLVINHIGSDNPWFASPDPNIRKDNWFIWADSDKGWDDSWNNSPSGYFPNATFFKDPFPEYDRNGNGNKWDDDYFFSVFGDQGGCTMPDLNFNDENSKNQIVDEIGNIMEYWINTTGVDGFRCDAARYLVEEGQGKQADRPKTHQVWQDIRARLKAISPGAILLAESPTQNYNQMLSYYGIEYTPNDNTPDPNDGYLDLNKYPSEEFHSAFHFNYQGTLIAAARDSWWPSNLFTDLYAVQSFLPKGTQDSIFLSNHDAFAGARVATQLGEDVSKIKMAASLYLTLSGNPTIYYGEEYGMKNGPGQNDEPIRGNMDWGNVESQESNSGSIVNHYKGLLNLRNSYDALRAGISYFAPVHDGSSWNSISSGGKIVAYAREWYGEVIIVIHNFSDQSIPAHVDLTAGGSLTIPTGDKVYSIMGSGTYSDISAGNKGWYDLGSISGKTSKILFLGDISSYSLMGSNSYPTYENIINGSTPTPSYYFRGTPNNWGVTKMDFNEDSGLYETTQTFDSNNPRFKISASSDPGNWSQAYPNADYLITEGAGPYLIQFNPGNNSILNPIKKYGDSYALSGFVKENGVGVSGVVINFGTYSATTNSSGAYLINSIPDGYESTVSATLGGYTFSDNNRALLISGSNITNFDFIGTKDLNNDLIIHYREWQSATSYSVHSWNGVDGDFLMNYEGLFNSSHWWKGRISSAPDTFSFCFKNSNNNWDGVNRNYNKAQHGSEIYIVYGDPNIYTNRP